MRKANLKYLLKQVEEIKSTQERILEVVTDALYPTTSSDFERNRLIAKHGGDVLAAFKEHNSMVKIRNSKPRTLNPKSKTCGEQSRTILNLKYIGGYHA